MIITRTPLRISFAGGGTDICDYYRKSKGAVVSAAIDKYIYITVNKKFDNNIRVSYSKTEIVPSIEELHHELVRECLKLAGIEGGIEITSISDIPSGTGLGSSSTFTVGVLNALFHYTHHNLTARQLAELACKVEIDILGHPIGKQDQYAAAYGGINYFGFNPDDSVEHKNLNLSDIDLRKLESKLMMFYTGITRSADNVLTEQKKNTKSKLSSLNYMKSLADSMYNELYTNGVNSNFGEALTLGWQKKRELASSISNPEIDEMLRSGIEAGAAGGKLLGAGGGGFLLFYCDEQYQDNLRDSIGLTQTDIRIDRYGSRVVYFA